MGANKSSESEKDHEEIIAEQESNPDEPHNVTIHTSSQLTCIVVGGGQRGWNYASYALDHPDKLKVVGICDPSKYVRDKFTKKYGLNEENVFTDWVDAVKREKFADFVCICTPDHLHKEVALSFTNLKYHILLEKPMATTKNDCIEIVEACTTNNVILSVCHVLRYYPANKKIKEIIDTGLIGNVVSIQHIEPVGHWHFAHSYVRGNWRNTAKSSFSLLAKSCHDIDLFCYWINSQCNSVSSFGSLKHFKKENKPAGGGMRCLDCAVEAQCPYSAKKIYLDRTERGYIGWPVSVVSDIEDVGNVTERLKNGPYGRCVYECDNDVCDNQIVNLQFENGVTVSFTMIAFSEQICQRTTRIFGTHGEIKYTGGVTVEHFDFLSGKLSSYNCHPSEAMFSKHLQGHGGADYYLIDSFVKAVQANDSSLIKSGPEETLQSHLLVFACEESRLQNKTLHREPDGTWS